MLDWALRAALPALASTPIGTIFTAVNTAIGLLALALIARLVYRLTASAAVAAAIAVALVATSVFERRLAPAIPLALLAASAGGWLQLLSAARRPADRTKHFVRACGCFALIPLLAPAAVFGCPAAAPPPFGAAARDAIAALGPLPYALAALGLFAAWSPLQRPEARGAALLAAVPLVLAFVIRAEAAGVAILAAAVWCLAAVGLAQILAHAGTRGPARLLAIAIVVLVPLLQWQRLSLSGVPPLVVRDGHDAVTLEAVGRLVRRLPAVTIVDEDASTQLLLRAARVERLRKQLVIVPRNPTAVATAVERGVVFAFARAQRELQYRGVEFTSDLGGSLARVQAVRPCVSTALEWQDVSASLAGARFALVAPTDAARGPVEVYLGSAVPLGARAEGWAPRDLRGFQMREYERARRPDLEAVLRQAGVDPASPILTAPRVTRLELWRTPGAPATLPLVLAAPPSAAVARAVGGPGSALELCPWLEFPPTRGR